MIRGLLFGLPLLAAPLPETGHWPGVDETVVGRIAAEAGRPARRPFIDTDQGDLLLFVFLSAGIVGGFALGYGYRQLFVENVGAPPKRDDRAA